MTKENSAFLKLPISELPFIENLIDGMAENTQESYELLLEAKESVSSFDKELLEKLIRLFTERKEYIEMHLKQLQRWEQEADELQIKKIKALQNKLFKLEVQNTEILEISDYVAQNTIEKVLNTEELEMVFKTLAGEILLPKDYKNRVSNY